MMDEADPRVKKLQDAAWSLQSLTNKPGGKVPEEEKRRTYKVTSKAIDLCQNASYLEEADFLERAEEMHKEIQEKRTDVQEIEAAELEHLKGKCYKATSGGGYAVSQKQQRNGWRALQEESVSMRSSSSRASTRAGACLSTEEVVTRCSDDPEALFLSGADLRDSDMDCLCEGLKRAGPALTCLDLSHNSIADAGVQKLVSMLASGTCPKLEELWLVGNDIGPLGLQMLSGGLKVLRKDLVVHTESGGAERASPSSTEPPCKTEADGQGQGAAPASGGISPQRRRSETGEEDDEQKVVEPRSAASDASATSPHSPTNSRAAAPSTDTRDGTPSSASTQAATVDVTEDDAGSSIVKATITLPSGVVSMSDLELHVNENRLLVRLTQSGVDFVDLALPMSVDAACARAALSRKRGALVVTMRAL